MRAYQLDSFGSLDALVAGELPDPEPGPREVLVRVRARSLNYRDLLILNRRYPVPARPGVVPVSDGAGEVVAVGDDTSAFTVGDRVAATYFPRWIDGRFALALAMEQFGCTRDGMLAEYVLAEDHALVRVPDHLSFEEAATLPCAALTAWSGLTGGRPPTPAETVLTIGTGGVALFALQLAKLLGARVIATTSGSEKADLLTRLGADAVVNRKDAPEWEVAVRELTDGRGVDRVVETGAIDTLPRSLASCAAEGEVALAAVLGAGSLDAIALSAPVTIRRYYVGSRAAFEGMNAFIAEHRLDPVIDRVFGFDEVRKAYEHFAAKRHVGKVVIAG
jgi:NADPH:quinone reductase-like Zn-dependent oxidoreductase